jgi:hypothetical protein
VTIVTSPLDVELIRKDFPVLERTVHDDRPLVYLDSANTSQKPRAVLDAMDDFYARHNANVARAIHALGEEATALYEARATRSPPSSVPRERGRVHQERLRGAQPRGQRARLGQGSVRDRPG